jgi:probable O-glycosylation ligase (exosortase A-associated)
MVVMTMGFSFKALTEPFWAVALYYLWGVLRPQALWQWSMGYLPDMRWSLIAAVIALITLVIRSGSLGRPKVEPGFVSMVFMFGVCVLGSYICAYNMDEAGGPSWEYSKIIIMLMVASLVVTETRYFRYLCWIVFGALIYLVYHVNSLYVFDGRLDIIEGMAGLDNNGAALMLAMVIPFCYYFFQAEQRWWRWGFLICMLATAHAVMLTHSRGAMLSSILAFVGMVLTTKTKRWQMIGIAVVMGAIVMSLAGEGVRARFLTFTSKEGRTEDASAQSRYGSWEAGLKIARDNPIFGVGPRNSKYFIKQYGADMEGRTIHNLPIQMAADCGFPCLFIYIALYFSSMIWAWKGATMVKNHTTSDQRWHHNMSLACFWSLALFLVGSFFLSLETFETPYLLMFLAATSQRFAADLTAAPEKELLDAVPEAEVVQR